MKGGRKNAKGMRHSGLDGRKEENRNHLSKKRTVATDETRI
jgi:hypothetical protein